MTLSRHPFFLRQKILKEMTDLGKMPKGMKFTLQARPFNEFMNAIHNLSEPKTVATGKNKDANGVYNREQNIADVKSQGKSAENKSNTTDRPLNKLVVEGLLAKARERKAKQNK